MKNPFKRISISNIGLFPLVMALIIGCPFIFVGLSEVYSTWQMVANLRIVRGVVVYNTWTAFASGSASYCPVVEFQTNEGKIVRFTDGIGSFPPDYQINEEVQVLYDPYDVHNARIKSWKRLWFAPSIFIVVGLLPLLIITSIIFLSSIHPKNKPVA